MVRSQPAYRMCDRARRRWLPLDDIRPTCWTANFTRELLEQLWILEATVERWSAPAKLLEVVVVGDCFTGGGAARAGSVGAGSAEGKAIAYVRVLPAVQSQLVRATAATADASATEDSHRAPFHGPSNSANPRLL